MKARASLLCAFAALEIAGCANIDSGTRPAVVSAPTKASDARRNLISSLERGLPSGTRVYTANSVVIRDGNEVAQFNAAAHVTRDATQLTVYDVQSAQTFRFSKNASVEYTSGTSRIYVEPGDSPPRWLLQAHGVTERSI